MLWVLPELEGCRRGGGGGFALGMSLDEWLGDGSWEFVLEDGPEGREGAWAFLEGGGGGASLEVESFDCCDVSVGAGAGTFADCTESKVLLDRFEALLGRPVSPGLRREGGGGGGAGAFLFPPSFSLESTSGMTW